MEITDTMTSSSVQTSGLKHKIPIKMELIYIVKPHIIIINHKYYLDCGG